MRFPRKRPEGGIARTASVPFLWRLSDARHINRASITNVLGFEKSIGHIFEIDFRTSASENPRVSRFGKSPDYRVCVQQFAGFLAYPTSISDSEWS